jgi:hypothetical protein
MGRRTILVDVWKGEQFSLCYGKKNISHCYGKKNNNSCCFGKENMTSLFLFYGKMNYYEKKNINHVDVMSSDIFYEDRKKCDYVISISKKT